jgi:hypothetical protein
MGRCRASLRNATDTPQFGCCWPEALGSGGSSFVGNTRICSAVPMFRGFPRSMTAWIPGLKAFNNAIDSFARALSNVDPSTDWYEVATSVATADDLDSEDTESIARLRR